MASLGRDPRPIDINDSPGEWGRVGGDAAQQPNATPAPRAGHSPFRRRTPSPGADTPVRRRSRRAFAPTRSPIERTLFRAAALPDRMGPVDLFTWGLATGGHSPAGTIGRLLSLMAAVIPTLFASP